MTPTVSIIIPNYNRAALIGQTLNNMLQQSLAPHEIIVIDDGSTDESVQVIQQFSDRVTLIQQSNQGPGAARNVGLDIATGEFIQFMDSDDLLSLNKLSHQVQSLIEHQADIAYGPWMKAYFDHNILRISDVVLQQQALPSHKSWIEWFLSGWSMVFQQCLFRHDFVKKVGKYRSDLWTCDDSEFFLRMLLASPNIVYVNTSLMLYRLDDYGKVTGSGFTHLKRIEDWATFLLIANKQCSTHPQGISAIHQPNFFTMVWKTWALLTQLNSSNHRLIQQLTEILDRSHRSRYWWRVRSRTKEIKYGIQHRIKGHRWPSYYQASQMTQHQKQLIQTMSLKII